MSKRNKGNHGIYSLTCISQKCGRKFGVMWELKNCVEVGVTGRKLKTGYWTLEEAKMGVLVYPFTGCPWCGTWWCTGPLDASAYPKRKLDPVFPVPVDYTLANVPLFSAGQQQASSKLSTGLRAQGQANIAGSVLGGLQVPWWETRWTW